MPVRFLTVDVFTDRRFGGNQLAVFPDAREVPSELMLDITREFNYSETTFVLPPENPANTRRVRIFTPGGEVPFAGHPTVGTAHVLAHIGAIPLTGARTDIVLEEGVGPIAMTVRAEGGQPTFAQFSVAKLPERGPTPPTRVALAEVLSLATDDLLDDDFTPEAFSCGLPFLFVALRNRDAVRRARIKTDIWERVLRGYWTPDVFVFALDPERPGSDVRARSFVPGQGLVEDPATGSACAALAGYLAKRRAGTDDTLRWVVEQGFEMGRPSIIEVEADRRAGALTAVRVGGRSVVVSEGMMTL